MKRNWKYIQVLVLIGLVIFLYGFSGQRNASRANGKIEVDFTNGKNLYITPETVNNLLIVKMKPTGKLTQDSLDLNLLERKLDSNPMIAKAEVYQTVTKNIGVEITQRVPLARVIGTSSYYIDAKGTVMPLSQNYSARVPLVFGIDTTDVKTLLPLLKEIQQDNFLEEHIISIEKKKSGNYYLRLRGNSIVVTLGRLNGIPKKIRNFKAFYKEAVRDTLLKKYTKINLKFTNQVVCTKKEE